VSLERYRVGQPVTRVKLEIDAEAARIDAEGVCRKLADGSPSIKPRGHHTDEGWFYLEPNHVTRDDLDLVASRLHAILRV